MTTHKTELSQDFVRTFIPALTKAHQYTISHQETINAVNIAYRALLTAIGGDHLLSILIIDERIIVQEQPLEDSLYTNRFARFFKARGIEHITFGRGITPEELIAFMEALTAKPKKAQTIPTFPHVKVGSVGLAYRTDGEGEDEGDPQHGDEEDGDRLENGDEHIQFSDIHLSDLDLMMEIYSAVKENEQLPQDEVRKIVSNIIAAIREESSMLLTFSALRVLDEYTFTHSVNVCVLTLAQAMGLGVEEEMLHDIGVAALLHDVGKIFVPEEVLNKQGKLTDAEWDMIRQHPQKGAEYLLDNPGVPPLAVTVAYEHHMQYDFSGYPQVSEGWKQNMCSQMTTISDFFDALRTKRIYRDSIETEIIAKKMMDMAGNALHPVLTKNFLILLHTMLDDAAA